MAAHTQRPASALRCSNRHGSQLKYLFEDFRPPGLGFVAGGQGSRVQFGQQGLDARFQGAIHGAKSTGSLHLPEVIQSTLYRDDSPLLAQQNRPTFAASSALGGVVRDERPATRTWVRDVRRFRDFLHCS